jgi:hypothetical protein
MSENLSTILYNRFVELARTAHWLIPDTTAINVLKLLSLSKCCDDNFRISENVGSCSFGTYASELDETAHLFHALLHLGALGDLGLHPLGHLLEASLHDQHVGRLLLVLLQPSSIHKLDCLFRELALAIS